MLLGISIKNFAVISSLDLELKEGLNIFTGETGAGKSVIIEAISMALGSRADTAFVRSGCDKAVVSLVIDTKDCDVKELLESYGIPDEELLIIRREISAQSKSICRVNGSIVPLSALSTICRKVADIHGQYDQQTLLDVDNHLNIIDGYGKENIYPLKRKVEAAFDKYAALSTELYRLRKQLTESKRNRDFLRFEYNEISAAGLKSGEDEALEGSIRIMQNGEQLYSALSRAYSELFGSESSVDSTLGAAAKSLESIKGYSDEIDFLVQRLNDTYYELEDMNSELRSLRERINFSEEELDRCYERIDLINSLKRKYGGSIDSVLEYASKAEKQLSEIENADDTIQRLEKELGAAKAYYDACSEDLSFARLSCAEELKRGINKELSELNFIGADFSVCFTKTKSSANGTDHAEFLISTNPGEDLKPLAKVASGGELSRVMLALKRVIGDSDSIPTMIFDEIDTGISGSTAAVVGDKLESIARNHQVICITHLPQIACRGSHHYKIEKNVDLISANTTIVPLNKEERIEEVARLLSGTNISDSARAQAKLLIEGNGQN